MSRLHVQCQRIFIAGILLLVAMTSPCFAASEDETKTSGKPDTTEKKTRLEVSSEDRDAAMKFAAEHHPELARLLEQLEKSRPHEFARAVKELNQQIQVLERIREKNAPKYQAQLEAWKQDSQIRVMMARWSRSKDVELEKQVRALLLKRREAKLAQLKAEKDRLAEQQRKLEEQLALLSAPIEAQVDQEWGQLSKKAGSKKDSDKKKTVSPTAAETVKQ